MNGEGRRAARVESPERPLVVAPSWVGDATMATPAFRALRSAWPNAAITLLCRPGIDRVLDGIGCFDGVIVDRLGGAIGPLRGGWALRARRFDLAVLFPNSFRTALAVRIGSARRRIGYGRDGRSLLLTDAVSPPSERPTSTVDWYCDLVERGVGVPVPDRTLRLAVTERDRANAAGALASLPSPYALLVPGGNRAGKRWPPERFALVAEHLAGRHGLHVAASGSPGERPIIGAIRAAASVEVTDLSTAGLDIGGLKAVVAGARLVVTNDTGPRHVAAAFRVPTVALFGPTDHRWTLLRDVPERVLVAEPFLPEELVADDRPTFCAIDRIAVADVTTRCDELLAGDHSRTTSTSSSFERG